MPNTKPILFNTAMVHAILREIERPGTGKTQTRRIIKNRSHLPEFRGGLGDENDPNCWGWECGESGQHIHMIKPEDAFYDLYYCPFYKGLKLWVRETFHVCTGCGPLETKGISYRADNEQICGKWKPSIHMPKWASRISAEIMDVRVERLQDISEEDAIAEGLNIKTFSLSDIPDPRESRSMEDRYFNGVTDPEHGHECPINAFKNLWDLINAKPSPVYKKDENGKKVISHYVSYPWEDVQTSVMHKGNPNYIQGNPWVWVIDFKPQLKNILEVAK